MSTFEIAGGSVLGRDHLLNGKNNQDAFYWIQKENNIVAVVCDGCGSSLYSEVGAQLGARLISNRIMHYLRTADWDRNRLQEVSQLLEKVKFDILAELRVLANGMGNKLPEVVEKYLLFTVVGAAITPSVTFFFNMGDGVALTNGNKLKITGTLAQNTPAYLGYNLVSVLPEIRDKKYLDFQIPLVNSTSREFAIFSTSDIDSFLIGTDGVEGLEMTAKEKMPGKETLVGGLDQFWSQDRFFKNSDQIRRHLNLTNREVIKPDWESQIINKESGHLRDDTTLIVGRKVLKDS